MKKLLLSLTFSTLMVFAFAQGRNSGAKWYFGGGPTFSKFTGDGGDNKSILVGAQVALGTVWQLGNNFSVVPELNISMQGSKVDVSPEQRYRMWYLNLPVVVRYQFGNSGFFAETGPQIGLLVDSKVKINDDLDDADEGFEPTSVNWNFGLGYNITPNIAVNARVAPGISDIAKNESAKEKMFTSAVRVLFGF
jgi:Outer membrane protein beta-barrel domain